MQREEGGEAEEEEGKGEEEERRGPDTKQCFFVVAFLSFAAEYVFQLGDAAPLSLSNRAGKSLDSTAKR